MFVTVKKFRTKYFRMIYKVTALLEYLDLSACRGTKFIFNSKNKANYGMFPPKNSWLSNTFLILVIFFKLLYSPDK